MSVARDQTLGQRIESLPKTVLFACFGFSVLGFGFLLDFLGMGREAGLAGALAVILIGLAAVIHLIYWILGRS